MSYDRWLQSGYGGPDYIECTREENEAAALDEVSEAHRIKRGWPPLQCRCPECRRREREAARLAAGEP